MFVIIVNEYSPSPWNGDGIRGVRVDIWLWSRRNCYMLTRYQFICGVTLSAPVGSITVLLVIIMGHFFVPLVSTTVGVLQNLIFWAGLFVSERLGIYPWNIKMKLITLKVYKSFLDRPLNSCIFPSTNILEENFLNLHQIRRTLYELYKSGAIKLKKGLPFLSVFPGASCLWSQNAQLRQSLAV